MECEKVIQQICFSKMLRKRIKCEYDEYQTAKHPSQSSLDGWVREFNNHFAPASVNKRTVTVVVKGETLVTQNV